jgi:hypothetical protein
MPFKRAAIRKGCGSFIYEQARLRTAPRLVNLLVAFCILSWRVLWLTMTNRIDPDADPELVFTDLELRILDRLVNDKLRSSCSNTGSRII